MDMDMIRTRLGLKPVDKSSWSKSASSKPISLSSFFGSVAYHVHTAYLFSATDIHCIIGTGMAFGFLHSAIAPALSMGPAHSLLDMAKAAPIMITYLWGNLLLTEFHNQRHPESIAEDMLNKPWRPVPAGRVTVQQLNFLLYCIYPFNLLVASTAGGLIPSIVLAIFCIWYNEFGGASDPFLKGFHNGMGITSFWAGTLEVATGHSIFSGDGHAAIWLGIMLGMISTTSQLQDFRDMDGDAAGGRRTVPLVLGDMTTRVLSTISMYAWSAIACWFWEASFKQAMLPFLAATALVYKLFTDRTRKGDGEMWKLWSPWVLTLYLMPVLKHYDGGIVF